MEEECREEVEQRSIQTHDIEENGRKRDQGKMMEVSGGSRNKGYEKCGGVGGLQGIESEDSSKKSKNKAHKGMVGELTDSEDEEPKENVHKKEELGIRMMEGETHEKR